MQAQAGMHNEPLMVNTLEEASTWLTERQGITWTPKRILDHVFRMGLIGSQGDSDVISHLGACAPGDSLVGVYSVESNGAIRLEALKHGLQFQVTISQVFELLENGVVRISSIPTDISVKATFEPHGTIVEVTTSMLRVSASALKCIEAAAASRSALHPVSQVRLLPEEWETPEHRQVNMMIALRRVAMNHDWAMHEWLPLARAALAELEKWDGHLVGVLRAGPLASRTQSGSQSQEGLTTREMDDVFGNLVPSLGLYEILKNGAKWVIPARLSRGTKGGRHRTKWDPVVFSFAYESLHGVSRKRLQAIFDNEPLLAPWRDSWADKSHLS
jgi:hypothetical protein